MKAWDGVWQVLERRFQSHVEQEQLGWYLRYKWGHINIVNDSIHQMVRVRPNRLSEHSPLAHVPWHTTGASQEPSSAEWTSKLPTGEPPCLA